MLNKTKHFHHIYHQVSHKHNTILFHALKGFKSRKWGDLLIVSESNFLIGTSTLKQKKTYLKEKGLS